MYWSYTLTVQRKGKSTAIRVRHCHLSRKYENYDATIQEQLQELRCIVHVEPVAWSIFLKGVTRQNAQSTIDCLHSENKIVPNRHNGGPIQHVSSDQKEEKQDILRFHWRRPNLSEIEVTDSRTRLISDIASFLLEGVIGEHLDRYGKRQHPKANGFKRKSRVVSRNQPGSKDRHERRLRRYSTGHVWPIGI